MDKYQTNQLLISELDRVFLQTIHGLSGVMEIRDLYTLGHQNKVADISRRIAQEMGLDAKVIEGVRLGGTLHDIGKIGIPNEILTKPSRLISEEYELVKTHCAKGLSVLNGINFPWPVAEMVHQHHERLDGSGYPLGLVDADILIESQIIGIADTVDSIDSHRPYRRALGLAEAMKVLRDGAGHLFNSAAVDACCRLIERNEISSAN